MILHKVTVYSANRAYRDKGFAKESVLLS